MFTCRSSLEAEILTLGWFLTLLLKPHEVDWTSESVPVPAPVLPVAPVWTCLVLGLLQSGWEFDELVPRFLCGLWSFLTNRNHSVTVWTSTFPFSQIQTQSSTTYWTVLQTWSSTDLRPTTTLWLKVTWLWLLITLRLFVTWNVWFIFSCVFGSRFTQHQHTLKTTHLNTRAT